MASSKSNRGKLYVYYGKDDLPEVVADTPQELARILGITTGNIFSQISRYKAGKIKKCSYAVVDLRKEEL